MDWPVNCIFFDEVGTLFVSSFDLFSPCSEKTKNENKYYDLTFLLHNILD